MRLEQKEVGPVSDKATFISLNQATQLTGVSASVLKRNAEKHGFGRRQKWGTWDIYVAPLREWLKQTGRYAPTRYFS